MANKRFKRQEYARYKKLGIKWPENIKEDEDDNILFLLKTALYEYLRDGYSTVIESYLTTFFGKLLKHYQIKKQNVSRLFGRETNVFARITIQNIRSC